MSFYATESASQEAALFAKLRLANGTFKTTAEHRLDDLNEFTLKCWRESGFRPTEVLDVGVSSGITTCEWFDELSRAGFSVRMIATDVAMWGNLVSLWPGISVLEAGGHILQHIIFGISIRPWRRRLDYVTGYVLIGALANSLAHRRLRLKHLRSDRVSLLSPRAERYAQIEWDEDDILAKDSSKFIRRFDAIRIANLLNKSYFDSDQIRCAAANLRNRLRGENCVLIVNRTLDDGSNHATMFRLTKEGRFEVTARLGQGSEIENIILCL